MTQQERFEAWASGCGKMPMVVAKDDRGDYILARTSAMWQAWQAALPWTNVEDGLRVANGETMEAKKEKS